MILPLQDPITCLGLYLSQTYMQLIAPDEHYFVWSRDSGESIAPSHPSGGSAIVARIATYVCFGKDFKRRGSV